MHKFLSAASLLFIFTASSAQNKASISITIYNDLQSPLENATVALLKNLPDTMSTDA